MNQVAGGDMTTSTNRAAVRYMCMSVFGYSLIPILIVAVGGTESPFLLGGSQAVGHIMGGIAFLASRYRRSIRSQTIHGAIRRNIRSPAIVFSTLAPFTFAFLAWATAYLDATIATVLWGSWPILLVLFLARFDRTSTNPGVIDANLGQRSRITPSLLFLMLVGLVGLGFAVMSQSAPDQVSNLSDLTDSLSILGVIIALGSAWLASLTAWHFRWANRLVEQLDERTLADLAPTKSVIRDVRHEGNLFFVVVCLVIGNTIAAPIMISISLSSSERVDLRVVLGALVIGLIVRTPAAILWRISNLVTRDYGVNALNYLEPLLALLWLGLFWDVSIENIDFLVIGVTGVMASNILINSRVEIGSGFKATIIALWTAGTIVYFRHSVIIWKFEGYFEILALSATIFALILAFRITRVLSVTSEEDQAFIRLVHQFELQASRNVLQQDRNTVFGDLYTIDTTPEAHSIEPAYQRLQQLLHRARESLSPDQREHADLSALEADLHVFVNSKQKSWNFGEFFSLSTFALLTVLLGLFGHPRVEGWTAFLLEMFMVPFCAVIVFLIFNAWDLQRNRYRSILIDEDGVHRLYFHETEDRRIERLISVLVSIGIWCAFGYLFWTTWL